jgi:hypothetical protein
MWLRFTSGGVVIPAPPTELTKKQLPGVFG